MSKEFITFDRLQEQLQRRASRAFEKPPAGERSVMPTTGVNSIQRMTRGCLLLAGLLIMAIAADAQTRAVVPPALLDTMLCLSCATPAGSRKHSSPTFVFSTLAHRSDALGFTRANSPTPSQDALRIPRRARGALFGAVFGAAVGGLLGAAVGQAAENCSGEGPCGLGGVSGAMLGGAVGLILGGLIGFHLTEESESTIPAPAA
jgi:hypothetical protein